MNRHVHVVLIPGFGGFDALGQLEYYSGLTPVFQNWVQRAGRPDVVLHYFDNFPTAAVVTRAKRLESYLAKRVLRGEIAGDDEIVLIGHSTGGLDIRRLIWNLSRASRGIWTDSGRAVEPEDVLARVRRVVFLSVPHWGTNAADWVRSHWLGSEAFVTELRAGVFGSQLPFLDAVGNLVTKLGCALLNVDLLLAMGDALAEADPRGQCWDPERTAEALEAAADLQLWLRHMAWDFGAIDDLSADADGDLESPAHFSGKRRVQEQAYWRNRIETLSYATVGPSPGSASGPTDPVYRFCYERCAAGPFTREAQGFRCAENDGIVNTSSMPWPEGEKAVVVHADHMDIVGHHTRVPADDHQKKLGRQNRAYDLLGSGSGFGETEFRHVWREIFDFCGGR